MLDILKLLNGLVTADSPANYIFEHPVLLSPAWHRLLAPALTTEKQKATLTRLIGFARVIREDPAQYPIGPGPVERIYGQVRRGEITKTRGLELAANADVFSLLSPFYVRHLSIAAESNARDNDWKTGVPIEQLILSALDARRGQIEIDQAEMDFIAVIHWLDIVARAVWEVPEGTLFRDALKRGEKLAAIVNDPGDFYPPAEILNRLGILHLDPYVYARRSESYEQEWSLWQQRLDQERSREMAGAAKDADRIPRAETALPEAAKYLRRAAPHRSGTDRGLTLKALLQALVWHYALGLSPGSSEVEAVAAEALQLLPPKGYESARTEIENLLQWHAVKKGKKRTVDSSLIEDARQMLLRPLDQWLSQKSSQGVIQLFMQMSRAVSAQPDLALKLWLAIATLIPDQDEQLQSTYYDRGREYVRLALAEERLPAEGEPLGARVAAVKALGHDSYSTAAMIFALAVRSGATNEEEAGVDALYLASRLDAKFTESFYSLLQYTISALRHDAAVGALKKNQPGDAARLYMLSAYDRLAIRQPQRALEAFEDALSLTNNGDAEAIQSVVVFLAEVGVRLEQQLGDLVGYKLQVIYRTLLARIVQTGRPLNPVLLLFFWQAAKGNAFSHALANGAPLAWLGTADARRIEQNIHDLASHVVPEPWRLFDESTLLTSYASLGELHGGTTAGQRLRNLQIDFDTEVNRQLVTRDVAEQSWYLTDSSLQASLGSSTVLLSQYLGVDSSGSAAMFTFIATREELGLTTGIVPSLFSGIVVYGDGKDGSVVFNPFAPFVESVRKSLQEEPGPRSASDKALHDLRPETVGFFGGGLDNTLERYRSAGKNHLCICPHGPYHFFPYHLIGSEDHPLAEEWMITYLSNLRLLDPSRGATKRTDGLIAIGLDFAAGNSRGLPELSGPEAEAKDIANLTRCACLTGAAVTAINVIGALQRYSRIHIATHGDLEVSAPSFQCLHLSPDGGIDRLNAYEILRLDLRGIDLVTLSACETALGRFDFGDNLRGIPASLLIAGVSTIVGTLWPVETNTAQTFFTSLYSYLQGSTTKGEAFHAAQKETRKQYPQYRDWGAFYLIGAIV